MDSFYTSVIYWTCGIVALVWLAIIGVSVWDLRRKRNHQSHEGHEKKEQQSNGWVCSDDEDRAVAG